MAATLKLCLMSHIEDGQTWDASLSSMFGYIATAIGTANVGAHGGANYRGAKLSLQFGRDFLDRNASVPHYPAVGGSSLSWVLENGGNFWVQVHCTTYDHLTSTHACVMSAYTDENALLAVPLPAVASEHVSGRSGGWGPGVDWASITVARGMRRQNSAVMKTHLMVPDCLRPYGLSDDDLDALYAHDAAPGPLHADVATMRLRPFWVDNASCWFDKLTSTYPSTALVGSLMMIPKPGRFSLHMMADRRGAVEGEPQITVEDLNACLTEIWTCFMLMTSHQPSISNVWYKQVQHGALEDLGGDLDMIFEWIDSINEIMCVFSTPPCTPYAKWMNMNEICDCFSHTTSMYY